MYVEDSAELETPDEPIVDLATGFYINGPLGWQGPLLWWEQAPETLARLLELRKALGIEGIDDHFGEFPTVPDEALVPEEKSTPTPVRITTKVPRRLHEGKAMVRRVRTAEGMAKYGLPMGTVIGKDVKPKIARKPRTVSHKNPKGKTSQRAARMHLDIEANTTNKGRLRAWGPEEEGQAIRRANVASRKYREQYVSAKELDAAREVVIARAKKTPRPQKWDIADNKRILKLGGAGAKNEEGRGKNDNLRGNIYQRSANSWAIYVAFGGVNAKTGRDKGYVPCIGCGLKMTWHDNEDYSGFPKFEQDKIITSAAGGQYNPQNLAPACAGCNNQRGNKSFWLSPAFKGSKPSWHNAAFMEEVRKTRAKKRNGTAQRRPAKEVPDWVMPVPPGSQKPSNRKAFQIKSAAQRARNLLLRNLAVINIPGVPKSGDRVQANLYNFDGRREHVFIPDVAMPDERLVGKLIVETVDSAWGEYERYLLITDKGAVRIVEADTILVINAAVDISEGKDYVRTPAGADRWGIPIGSHIPGTPTGRGLPKGSNKLPRATVTRAENIAKKISVPATPKAKKAKEVLPFVREEYPGDPHKGDDAYSKKKNAEYRVWFEKLQKNREMIYNQRNQPPVDSGDYEGMTHHEMLDAYEGVVKKFSIAARSSAAGKARDAVLDYTGDGYRDMNLILRTGTSPDLEDDEIEEVEKQIKAMRYAMKNSPGAPTDMVVYRTTAKESWPVQDVGTTFIDRGFTSTTISPGYLDEVEEELYSDSEEMVVLEIRLPKGTPGVYATAFQKRATQFDTGEQEFVVKDGTEYKVVEVFERNGKSHMILEVVK